MPFVQTPDGFRASDGFGNSKRWGGGKRHAGDGHSRIRLEISRIELALCSKVVTFTLRYLGHHRDALRTSGQLNLHNSSVNATVQAKDPCLQEVDFLGQDVTCCACSCRQFTGLGPNNMCRLHQLSNRRPGSNCQVSGSDRDETSKL